MLENCLDQKQARMTVSERISDKHKFVAECYQPTNVSVSPFGARCSSSSAWRPVWLHLRLISPKVTAQSAGRGVLRK